ncbi:MAG: elongation factor G [candidate division Zixibacteria bacterium]|nr:elongation factor G [candidate division Zixibacteria bacterium]
MKEFSIDNIRNVGLLGHGGTGKTSLCEAMLFSCGAVNRMGRIEEGNTTTDYSDEEVHRRMSVSLALAHAELKGKKFNLVDTPGYADFYGEVASALRVVDTVVCLLNAPAGLEVGAEHVLQALDEGELPRVFFVNKMDKEHADFAKALAALTDRYGVRAVPVQWPIGQAAEFKGIIDLVRMKGYKFDATGNPTEQPIPDDLRAAATTARASLVEAAAEASDALMEKFFAAGDLSDDELQQGLAAVVASGKVFPVLCGAATTAAGVRLLLEFIEHFCPAPAARPPVTGTDPDSNTAVTRAPNPAHPLCALVFKTVAEPHVGELSLIRVFSGHLKAGEEAVNTTRGETERIGTIYVLNGKQRAEIGVLGAGDMGGIVKLKSTHTGDTLSDRKSKILLPPIQFPAPIFDMAAKAAAKGDDEKMGTGLARLHEEDPTFTHKVLSDIHQTILYGQGELHFDVIISKLKKRFGVEVTLEKPRIPYRETITATTEVEYKHKKQTGGRGQYGHVLLRLEPRKRGEGFEFVDEIKGGVIPSKFIPSVEKGVVEAMLEGGLSGHPVVDMAAAVYYGSYHDVDSSDMAFKIAGLMGFREGFLKCRPVMLEPIYEVQIRVPDDYTGDVMGDMSSRRGKILGMEPVGKWETIRAHAPLAELYKYSTILRSLTQGRGTYSRTFSHYAEVPREIAAKVIEEAKAAKKAAEE